MAFAAIGRRDIARHREWMIRAYALALGASTQIFTLGFGQAIFGDNELSTALLTGGAWVINLAIAEWVIRRRFRRPPARGARLVPAQKERQAGSAAVTSTSLRDTSE